MRLSVSDNSLKTAEIDLNLMVYAIVWIKKTVNAL